MSKTDFEQKKALPRWTLGVFHHGLGRTITRVGGYCTDVAECDWERNINPMNAPSRHRPSHQSQMRNIKRNR